MNPKRKFLKSENEELFIKNDFPKVRNKKNLDSYTKQQSIKFISEDFFQVLKGVIKDKDLSYAELSKKLSFSLSTLKTIFHKKDISFSRCKLPFKIGQHCQ